MAEHKQSLTLQETKGILSAVYAMEEEIHHPGAARSKGYNLLAVIEDTIRRLGHVIDSNREA